MTSHNPKAVVIGASAGALDALTNVLKDLPSDFALPILVVTHLPPDRNSILAELIAAHCKIPVTEAEDKEPIERGHVYFAPPDYHLLVETDGRLSLSNEEPVHFSRPSVDVLFESAADAYGEGLIGIILTGANEDGARGLRAIATAGGAALVQNPEGAYAKEMPLAALRACPQARSLSLNELSHCLSQLGRRA